MSSSLNTPEHVAECLGVRVPPSPLLNDQRIERINAARYEGQEIAGALKVVRPGDRVLEMGAGIGLVGAITLRNARPERVLSFEANPALIPHIEALYRLNGLEDRIEVRNRVLVSDPKTPESLPFHVRNSYLGSSLIDAEHRQTEAITVQTEAFEPLRATFAPDVILMDIEGGELEFLRHARLDGVRAIVIEFHPDAYGVEGMRECKRILERAGFARVPRLSTRTVWAAIHAPELGPPQPDGGWSRQIEQLEDAVVVPPSDTGFVQKAGVLRRDGSYCAAGALWRNGRGLTERPEEPEDDLPLRKGTWLWGGVLWMHFGHFLVESAARLWALDALEATLDGILFIPKRPRNGDEVIGFQRDFADLAGADCTVACAGTPERVERLIVPGQGVGLGNMIEGTPEFRAFARDRFAAGIAPEGPEKLYISRSALPQGRGNLIGEPELEARLEAEGYTIYHPQAQDLRHQIATYKAARQVIAAEGSALHLLAMVARPDARIAIVVRRPSGATRNLERQIASLTGHAPLMATHLARSWKPPGKAKPRLWMGELDMPDLHQNLRAGGFVSKSGPAWTPLETATVTARLGGRYEEVR
jgi:FkbM family methyltransferase